MLDGRRFRYPRSARLHRGAEIRAGFEGGARRRCGSLELYHAPASRGSSRAGIVVPRYGRTIVQRNRLKRRLREIVRVDGLPRLGEYEAPQEIVVRARPQAYESAFADLRESFLRCMESVR